MIIPPAKSAILIWLIHFLPSFIFLRNKFQFKFNNDLNKTQIRQNFYSAITFELDKIKDNDKII